MTKEVMISKTEFARLVGVDPTVISKLVGEKRLPLDEVTQKVPRERALKWWREEYKAKKPTGRPRSEIKASSTELYAKARATKTSADARIKILELQVLKGKLIEKADVEQDARNTAEEVKSILRSLPAKLAMLCDGKTAAEIKPIVDREINTALRAFAASVYAVEK